MVSQKDYLQDDINFQAGDVWKILVGGAKLSRGFTVEGLTVSYYTRKTSAADALMQMGRWFGYRPGYRDLVRLYIDAIFARSATRLLTCTNTSKQLFATRRTFARNSASSRVRR